MQYRHLIRLLCFVFVFATLTLIPSNSSNTSAYTTQVAPWYGKWKDKREIVYSVSDLVNVRLISGAKSTIVNNTMAQWSIASRLNFRNVEPFTTSREMYITAVDWSAVPTLGACPTPGDTNIAGFNCVEPHITVDPVDNTQYVDKSEVFLNSKSTLQWCLSCAIVTSGTPTPSSPWTRSVLNTSLHEVSHSFIMFHDTHHQEAAGYPHLISGSQVHVLQEDDKNGATQIYGPRMGWENGFPNGEIDTIAIWNGRVGSYDGNIYGFPTMNRTTAEAPLPWRETVIPKFDSWMERYAGCSETGGAYSYMRLFSSANDNSIEPDRAKRPYVRIKPGMRLVWWQYNFQQRTFSVDFKMISDSGAISFFRDSGLRDTTGRSVHPAGRRDYQAGEWFATDVHLAPPTGPTLANRKIIEWMIAYDDGGITFDPTRPCAGFRAYFDGLRIEYPAVPFTGD